MTPLLAATSWPKTTARLTLRPAVADDVEPTWRFRRLPEVGEWITATPPTLDEYTAHFLEEARLAKTLVVERDGEVVGDLMLAVQDAWAQSEAKERAAQVQAELGWVLHPRHAGQGLATEAVAELIRVCFEDLGLRRVLASCFADNVASWRLMERVGMRREAHLVGESLHRSRGWVDAFSYALLAEEWRAQRATGRPVAPAPAHRDLRHDWWGVVLDSPDARALGSFYASLLGWQLSAGSDDSDDSDQHCTVAPVDGVAYLGFQSSPDYVRPTWPSQPDSQQMMLHLDFEVGDLEAAVAHAVSLGARLLPHQPQEDVRVLADPDGHPFCLYRGSGG